MFPLGTLKITPEVLTLIAGIDEFKGAWRALGTLAPERLRALRHVATIESIASSTRIEGSKLTDREVERLLANLDIGSFAGRDQQEVAGYAEVMETVFRAWEEIAPTENHIKRQARIVRSFDDHLATLVRQAVLGDQPLLIKDPDRARTERFAYHDTSAGMRVRHRE